MRALESVLIFAPFFVNLDSTSEVSVRFAPKLAARGQNAKIKAKVKQVLKERNAHLGFSLVKKENRRMIFCGGMAPGCWLFSPFQLDPLHLSSRLFQRA